MPDLLDNPLVWPDLEDEMDPFRAYIHGLCLNAGSGYRPVQMGQLDLRIDVDPQGQPHLLADLHRLPLKDASVDTVVSIAVLEHTRRAWEVVSEFARVLRPGGHAVVAIPFLQPQHACPHDYVRFTAAGIAELMQSASLEVLQVRPVHHFGQTLAWLLWEYFKENPPPGWLRRPIGWTLRKLSTSWMRKNCQNAHNTFYVVARKSGEWAPQELPDPGDKDWFYPLLRCPVSGQPLQRGEAALHEPIHGHSYVLSHGIPRLIYDE